MFRFFANVVDPFRPYAETTPPRSVSAYIFQHLKPLRVVIASSLVFCRLVEIGRHAELLEKGGLYARLWSHQSGGFIGVK